MSADGKQTVIFLAKVRFNIIFLVNLSNSNIQTYSHLIKTGFKFNLHHYLLK